MGKCTWLHRTDVLISKIYTSFLVSMPVKLPMLRKSSLISGRRWRCLGDGWRSSENAAVCDFLPHLNKNKPTASSSRHARILLKDEQHRSSWLLENFHKGGSKNCIWCVRPKWIYSNGEEHGVNLYADRSLQVNHVSSPAIGKHTRNVLRSELSKFTYEEMRMETSQFKQC